MQRFPFIVLLVLTASAGATPGVTVRHVDVNGRRFRVEVQGDMVFVQRSTLVSGVTMELRDQMREAVKQATGCSITDEMAIGLSMTLQGKLLCAENASR